MDADRKKKLIACLLLMINVVGVLAMVDNGDLIQEMVCNDDSLRRKRDREEMERSEMATMKNLLSYHAPPQHPLPRIDVLTKLLRDPNRNYIKVFTSLYLWEFLALADHLRPLIERNRITKHRKNAAAGRVRRCKHDYLHRLYFTLQWLSDGREYKKMEFESGWSKSAIQEDIQWVALSGYFSLRFSLPRSSKFAFSLFPFTSFHKTMK